jgi:SAM-dependent methyltransferase
MVHVACDRRGTAIFGSWRRLIISFLDSVSADADWANELAALERSGHIAGPWVSEAIAWLGETASGHPIEHIIDVGCGPGFAGCTFAETIPSAQISALDPTALFLERTRQRAADLGIAHRISTFEGDIESTLPLLPDADLIWVSHVIHHLPDPVGALEVLGRKLTPHGRVAIAEGGLPMRVLPGGYGVGLPSFISRLEARLSDHYVNEWGLTPAAVGGARAWPVMLREAGLAPRATRTFLLDHPAPVDDLVRAHVVGHFTHVRDAIGHLLDRADGAALDRLLNADDEASLVRRPDLFVLSAQTVHVAGPR